VSPGRLAIAFICALGLSAEALAGQNSAPAPWDLQGIDQGLRYFAKFDEFGEGPIRRVPQKRLAPGDSLVQELRGGEVIDYGVSLLAGQLMEVLAEQHGIHVSVALYGLEKRKMVEVDSAEGTSGIQPLKWIATKPGVYTIEVSSPDSNAPPGSFVISFPILRQSETQDRKWLNAQQIFSQGFDVSKRLGEEAQSNAIGMLEEASRQWQALGETEREVQTQHALGRAKYTLGVIYEGGHGVPRNEERSRKAFAAALEGWYRAAAERGEVDAQTVMGDMFLFGRGVPRSSVQAVVWYERAAQQRGARAANNLACLYLAGLGTRQDYAEAMKWFRKAAEGGNVAATRNIGTLYRDGLGVPKDAGAATGWFRKAAEQGDEAAIILLRSP